MQKLNGFKKQFLTNSFEKRAVQRTCNVFENKLSLERELTDETMNKWMNFLFFLSFKQTSLNFSCNRLNAPSPFWFDWLLFHRLQRFRVWFLVLQIQRSSLAVRVYDLIEPRDSTAFVINRHLTVQLNVQKTSL